MVFKSLFFWSFVSKSKCLYIFALQKKYKLVSGSVLKTKENTENRYRK
jgi:hypothetical protein